MALRRDADGWERPSQLAAIRALIEREHLAVDRVVGSQFEPLPSRDDRSAHNRLCRLREAPRDDLAEERLLVKNGLDALVS
jgi:hypothetical protein